MKLHRRPHVLQAWLLAAVLLFAQGLAIAHSLAHAPGVAQAWSDDHEAGGDQCRLIDQLAHADVLCTGATSEPALPTTAGVVVALPRKAPAVAMAAGYLARAPPRG